MVFLQCCYHNFFSIHIPLTFVTFDIPALLVHATMIISTETLPFDFCKDTQDQLILLEYLL
jgi:hypothetical protein